MNTSLTPQKKKEVSTAQRASRLPLKTHLLSKPRNSHLQLQKERNQRFHGNVSSIMAVKETLSFDRSTAGVLRNTKVRFPAMIKHRLSGVLVVAALSASCGQLPQQTTVTLPSENAMGLQDDIPFKTQAALDLSLRRTALVILAKSKVGKYAGQSSQHLTNGKFATDISGGDGSRMRRALQIFKDSGWKTDRNTSDKMKAALSTYNNATDDATKIVQRIFSLSWSFQFLGLPKDDEATLTRLGIQQQCKEFVDRNVAAVGGTPKSYYSSTVSKASAQRGMLAYRNDNGHATIITEVIKDKNGSVTQFKVVDSNFGTGFSNPRGDVPWSRLVREHTVAASEYKVLDIN